MLVAASLFFRAILDFAGVVVFIPVLARVLEKEGDIVSVLPVAGAALAFILVKGMAVVWLTRYRSRFVYSLYGTLADTLLRTFTGKGLLFIRQSNSVDLANKVNAVTMTFISGVILSLLNVFSSVILLVIILTALFLYEPLPTLEAYLEQGKKDPSVRLVLEIKPHSTTNREDCAVLAVTGLVERLGMEAQVEYISFSLNICRKLKEFAPEAQVAYLEGNLSPDDVKRAGLDGIDYHHSLLATHPDWVARAHALGLTVNAWTVNREEDMRRLIEAGADFITTDNPLLLQKLLSEKKK